jgi:hypothetical protein
MNSSCRRTHEDRSVGGGAAPAFDAVAIRASLTSTIRTPKPKPRTEAEIDFLMLGGGANAWLIEAAATGAARIRRKMAQAVELARVLGSDRVDRALAVAAGAGRFGDEDLVSILDYLARSDGGPSNVVAIDEAHSAQPGTGP